MSVDRVRDIPNKALANIVTCIEMPEMAVYIRTQRTHMAGAFRMMTHLVEGDWKPSGHDEMREFIGRVVANATRQGIDIVLENPDFVSNHEQGEPAVPAPNSIPTGSRFETSAESYAAGFPDVPEPQWLRADATRMASERGEQLTQEPGRPVTRSGPELSGKVPGAELSPESSRALQESLEEINRSEAGPGSYR